MGSWSLHRPHKVRSSVASAAGIASLVVLAVTGAQAGASPGLYGVARSENTLGALTANSHSADALSIAEATAYGAERTAPALTVSGKALANAEAQAAKLPVVGRSWTQLSTGSDNAQPNGYTDPVWSNAGAGFREVGGRATALAADGSTIYAGSPTAASGRRPIGARTEPPSSTRLRRSRSARSP